MKMEYDIDSFDDKSDNKLENIKVKGYYSVNKNNVMTFDCSQLRYYIPHEKPSVHFDLNNGTKRIYHSDYSQRERFNNIIRWIKKNHENILASPRSGRWLQPNFILDYVILIRLLRTPFSVNSDWIFCAAKWKGNIYLRAFPSQQAKQRVRRSRPIRSERYVQEIKFKQHMVSDTANGSPMTDKILEGNTGFLCILQSHLGDHKLLYADPVQAVCSDEVLSDPLPLDKLKFIKLKVANVTKNKQRVTSYKGNHCFDWWTTMAPTGTETLVCGFKDNDIINELKTYRINDLPKWPKQNWSSSKSINFCNDFLYYVANTVRDDFNQTIYKFEKIPYGNIEVTEVLPFSEYSFLPEWYTRNTV